MLDVRCRAPGGTFADTSLVVAAEYSAVAVAYKHMQVMAMADQKLFEES